MSRIFGTDGVRGIANGFLTPVLAMRLGKAAACVLTKHSDKKAKIMVGCDTRISGDMLANALISGILSVGADACFLGVLPTPAVAYITRTEEADAGAVISASHNSFEYNGIKFFDKNGFKLPDSVEDEIEEYLQNDCEDIPLPEPDCIGRLSYGFEYVNNYVNHAIKSVNIDLSGMKIVIDCAEGASYVTSPKTLKALGAELVVIHADPDGVNINAGCGSTHLDNLKSRVVKEKADLGLAFDGDADRLLAVDENGEEVNGDEIMAVIGKYMKDNGTLKKDTIVATIMSNLGLFIMGDKLSINIEKTKVGDRYVLEKMREIGANLGGEQSGHIIFLDENTTGDGLLSALHLLEVIKNTGKKLSELKTVMEMLPQALVNATVPNDKKSIIMESQELKYAMNKVQQELSEEGRVLIRPSGTEPLIRVMIEGRDQTLIESKAQEIAKLIENNI